MSYEVTVKDIPPTLTLTHVDFCTLQTLVPTISAMQNDVKKNISGSFLCFTEYPSLKMDGPLRIHCPVANSYEAITEKKHKYEVVQRSKVVSTIHKGEYDQLEEAFAALHTYIEAEKLELVKPYRVIFHKEKRKWQRKRLLKRAVGEYVIEVQAEIVDTEEVCQLVLGSETSVPF